MGEGFNTCQFKGMFRKFEYLDIIPHFWNEVKLALMRVLDFSHVKAYFNNSNNNNNNMSNLYSASRHLKMLITMQKIVG